MGRQARSAMVGQLAHLARSARLDTNNIGQSVRLLRAVFRCPLTCITHVVRDIGVLLRVRLSIGRQSDGANTGGHLESVLWFSPS